MKLLIDSRIRDIEYNYLKNYFKIIKIKSEDILYDPICGHADIFYCKINNKIICATNAPLIEKEFLIGRKMVKNIYPNDVPYNTCQIGKKIIGSKYSDITIPVNIYVKQGYTKCSIAVTGENSCITSDIAIYKEIVKHNIEADYIEEENIYLLNRNGTRYSNGGFIGGATLIFDDKFVLFGDINTLKSKNIILEHLKKHGLRLIDFKGLEVYDYGGGIIY